MAAKAPKTGRRSKSKAAWHIAELRGCLVTSGGGGCSVKEFSKHQKWTTSLRDCVLEGRTPPHFCPKRSISTGSVAAVASHHTMVLRSRTEATPRRPVESLGFWLCAFVKNDHHDPEQGSCKQLKKVSSPPEDCRMNKFRKVVCTLKSFP